MLPTATTTATTTIRNRRACDRQATPDSKWPALEGEGYGPHRHDAGLTAKTQCVRAGRQTDRNAAALGQGADRSQHAVGWVRAGTGQERTPHTSLLPSLPWPIPSCHHHFKGRRQEGKGGGEGAGVAVGCSLQPVIPSRSPAIMQS